jgi:AI-2 transport protein TqsA
VRLPTSTMTTNARLQSLVYGCALALAVGWVLHIGRSVFVPIVLSALVVYVIVGLTRLLHRIPRVGRYLPLQVRYVLSALVSTLALAAIASVTLANLDRVMVLGPQYQASLLAVIQKLAVHFGIENEPTWATLRQVFLEQFSLQSLIGSTVVSATSIVASMIVLFLYVAFMLLEQRAFANKIDRIATDPGNAALIRQIIASTNTRIGSYLALKTFIGVLLGFASWAVMALFGLEFAVFLAMLIGLLNYVPYLGSFLGVLIPVALAVVQLGDVEAVLTLALSLTAVQFVIGNFLDPYLLGNSLNLSPLAILASLTVWTGLWGLPGAFLAVPITAVMTMVFSEFPGTRPVAVLLSRNGDL